VKLRMDVLEQVDNGWRVKKEEEEWQAAASKELRGKAPLI